MSNPHKGEVTVDADGQTYKLSYSANALVELEDALDRPLDEIMAMLMPGTDDGRRSLRLRDLRIMFWAALIDHQPQTTIEDAKLILSHVAPLDMGRLIGEAMVLAMPAQGDAARPQKPDQESGTGPASSTPISTLGAPRKPSGDRRRVS